MSVNTVLRLCLLGTAAASLAACSVLESDKVDYKSAATTRAPSLEVPPDLTQLSKDARYTVVDGAISAAGASNTKAANKATPIAAVSVGDVRIERQGNQRWLVVNRPAESLWEPVKDFWQENGFVLAMDQSNLGIMETDWAENRAKIPMDAIRSALGKLLDSFYSTPERDKFRTRLERSADGTTEIFISHRGMIEIYTSEGKSETVWQPRAADPELEAEFLRRLMVKLGVGAEQAKTAVAAVAAAKPIANIASTDTKTHLIINEGFDRAWRRVGLALDRTGFTVEDRDRKRGLYYVRYVPTLADGEEPGFFAKLFGKDKDANKPRSYQIAVLAQDQQTTVSVQDANGKPEGSEVAQRILKVLAADIK